MLVVEVEDHSSVLKTYLPYMSLPVVVVEPVRGTVKERVRQMEVPQIRRKHRLVVHMVVTMVRVVVRGLVPMGPMRQVYTPQGPNTTRRQEPREET
jgi:hypothetical protein